MAGKYATFSKWINAEIAIAHGDFQKPILAICPWGADQMSTVVRGQADEVAKWNTTSIVSAIRRLVP